MKRMLFLIVLILSAAAAFGQSSFAPPAMAITFSTDGGATWNPYSGVGGGTPLSFPPPAMAAYCSADGGATWLPCSFGGGGGGGGSFSAITAGTNNTTLHMGTGGSLDATGSGTITATALTGNIAESQVTGLTADLSARPTGSLTGSGQMLYDSATGVMSLGCGLLNTTTFDLANCANIFYGKGLAATGTAPTVGKFAKYVNGAFTAATSGDSATLSNLYLIAASHVVSGTTYYLACLPSSVCPATFTNTAVDGYYVEYDPTTQLATAVANCTTGNWVFGRTDATGRVYSQPQPCPRVTQVNGVATTANTPVNFINSSTNTVGLTLTATNTTAGTVQFEIGGPFLGTLTSGTVATTQTVGDNTNKVATDAFVLANAGSGGGIGSLYLSTANFGTIAASTTNYINVTGSGSSNTSQIQRQAPMPAACTFQNLYVQAIGTTSAGTATITLQKAGADTALTCTVAAATTAGLGCSDTTHTVTVAAGDLVNWRITTNATAGTTNATIAFPSVQCK